MTSVAVSPSSLIRNWSPWLSTTEPSVTWGRSSRSASIAGTTDMEPSGDAMPQTTTSTFSPLSPSFWIAAASTFEVAGASEPATASSTTCTPLSAPICSALRIASAACSGPTVRAVTVTDSGSAFFSFSCSDCSTAYSSSSDNSPGTPTRSTVLSDSNFWSAVESGTYFTQTTMFMLMTAPQGPSSMRVESAQVTSESTGQKHRLGWGLSQRSAGPAGREQSLDVPPDREVDDRRDPPVHDRVLGGRV